MIQFAGDDTVGCLVFLCFCVPTVFLAALPVGRSLLVSLSAVASEALLLCLIGEMACHNMEVHQFHDCPNDFSCLQILQ